MDISKVESSSPRRDDNASQVYCLKPILVQPAFMIDVEEYMRKGADDDFQNGERKLINFNFPDKNDGENEKEVKFEVFPEDQGRR